MKRLAVLAGLALVSCGCPYYVSHHCCAPSTDSTRVEIRERTVIDTARVEVPVEVERIVTRDTASHLENSWAESDAVVTNGELHHSLSSKPKVIKVPVEVTVRDTLIVEKEAQIIREEVERELSWWERTRLAMGDVFLLVLAAALVTFIVKKVCHR